MATWKRVVTPLIGDPDIHMFDLTINQDASYPSLPTTRLSNSMLSSGQLYYVRLDSYSITIENMSDYIVGVLGSETAAIIYPQSSTTFYSSSGDDAVLLTAALKGVVSQCPHKEGCVDVCNTVCKKARPGRCSRRRSEHNEERWYDFFLHADIRRPVFVLLGMETHRFGVYQYDCSHHGAHCISRLTSFTGSMPVRRAA